MDIKLPEQMPGTVNEHPMSIKQFMEKDGVEPQELPTMNTHLFTIRRKVLPIIFVPGLMGSRLKDGGKLVWDIDSYLGLSAWWQYGVMSAENRYKTLAAKRASFTVPGNPGDRLNKADHEHNEKFFYYYPHGVGRGWGGVYWDGYGDLLKALDDWDTPLKLFLDMPVYAIGYNWMLHNALSGAKVAGIIKQIKELHKAKHVLLITHSMGGLVARYACKHKEIGDIVYGVVHGAQPALGAVDAYRRMLAGHTNEGLTGDILANILGPDGSTVIALLAYSGGGLELLPNKHYTLGPAARNQDFGVTEKTWIHLVTRYEDGKQEYKGVSTEDPYTDIYKNSKDYWRLLHTEWLPPAASGTVSQIITGLENAKKFHDSLLEEDGSVYAHPRTIQLYSANQPTFCEIVWETAEITTEFREKVLVFTSDVEHLNSSQIAVGLLGKLEKYKNMNWHGILEEILLVKSGEALEDAKVINVDELNNIQRYKELCNDIQMGGKIFRRRLLNRGETLTVSKGEARMTLPRSQYGDGTVPMESARGLRPQLENMPEAMWEYMRRKGTVNKPADEPHCTFKPNRAEHVGFYDAQAILAAKNALHNLALSWLEQYGEEDKPSDFQCELGCMKT